MKMGSDVSVLLYLYFRVKEDRRSDDEEGIYQEAVSVIQTMGHQIVQEIVKARRLEQEIKNYRAGIEVNQMTEIKLKTRPHNEYKAYMEGFNAAITLIAKRLKDAGHHEQAKGVLAFKMDWIDE